MLWNHMYFYYSRFIFVSCDMLYFDHLLVLVAVSRLPRHLHCNQNSLIHFAYFFYESYYFLNIGLRKFFRFSVLY